MDIFTEEGSAARMRAKLQGLTESDLGRLVRVSNCAMSRAATLGSEFVVRLDLSPSWLASMAAGMELPAIAHAEVSQTRARLLAMGDVELAWLVWIASVALNEVAPTPAFLLEAAGASEVELEDWTYDVGLSEIMVDDLAYAARLVLGHFPEGLRTDGSNAPPIVLDFGPAGMDQLEPDYDAFTLTDNEIERIKGETT